MEIVTNNFEHITCTAIGNQRHHEASRCPSNVISFCYPHIKELEWYNSGRIFSTTCTIHQSSIHGKIHISNKRNTQVEIHVSNKCSLHIQTIFLLIHFYLNTLILITQFNKYYRYNCWTFVR